MKIYPINNISSNNMYKNQRKLSLSSYEHYNITFEAKRRTTQQLTRHLYQLTTIAAAGLIPAVKAKSSNDTLPSGEEFEEMLNSHPIATDDPKIKNFYIESFFKFYDINPEYALKFYDMKRSAGTLLRDLDLYDSTISSLFESQNIKRSNQPNGYGPDSRNITKEKYKFLKQLIDLKTSPDSYMFEKAEDAIYVMKLPFNFAYHDNKKRQFIKKRIIEILKMKNKDNTPRFEIQGNLRVSALEKGLNFLVEKPEIAQKYIDMKDNIGLLDIALIGQSYGYPTGCNWFKETNDIKALDELLSLKRSDDDSYVYDIVPNANDVKLYKEYPEEFVKLANQKDDKGQYIESRSLRCYGGTLETMRKYPGEYQEFIKTYPYYSRYNIKPDVFDKIYKNMDNIKNLLESKKPLYSIF